MKECCYLLGVLSYKDNKLASVWLGDKQNGGLYEVQRSL